MALPHVPPGTPGRIPFLALAVALLVALPLEVRADGAGTDDPTDDPTFYSDVLPILRENCQACHKEAGPAAGGMLAPMALETYEQARPWAPMIAEAVRERRMPPWSADERHQGTFIGERYLSEKDRGTLIAWAEQGAQAGDPSLATAEPRPEGGAGDNGWWLGSLDLVVDFPQPVVVGDDVADWQPTVVVPVSREQHAAPQWIRASELKAGGPYVHHIVSSHLGVGTPGRGPFVYPEGWGVLFPVDPVVTFNMHYYKTPGPGTEVRDETQGGFQFYEPGSVIDYVVETDINSSGLGLLIPAGAPNHEVTWGRSFAEDAYLLSMGPHSHYRGKSFQYELEYPSGEREVLLYIPDYDFNWQHLYQFKEPRLIPAGSTLHATWWFDNSVANPYNPDSTVDVRYGIETFNEMANARIYYASAKPRGIVVGEPLPPEIEEAARAAEDRRRRQIQTTGAVDDHN